MYQEFLAVCQVSRPLRVSHGYRILINFKKVLSCKTNYVGG